MKAKTLRDEFAMRSLPGLCAVADDQSKSDYKRGKMHNREHYADLVAVFAYMVADACMKVRDQ